MTHNVFFYPERAFLAFVRNALDTHKEAELPTEDAVVAVLACSAALESMVNAFFVASDRFRHFDELRLQSKIETLADWGKVTIDWGQRPWQDTKQLIRVRNWLAHFKDPDLGLTSLSEGWVRDDLHKPPPIDPNRELTTKRLKEYYAAVRGTVDELAKGLYGSRAAEDLPRFLQDQEGPAFEIW